MEHKVNTKHRPEDTGALVLVVRRDALTKFWERENGETVTDDDGAFAPLEVDEYGYLRMRLPDGAQAVDSADANAANREMRSLLRRLVAGLEMVVGGDIPDPNPEP